MHRVSLPLSERCQPSGWHLSGDELSSLNWKLHSENSLAVQHHLVRHAGMRACLYFPPENGAPEHDSDILWYYSCYGWCQQANLRNWVYTPISICFGILMHQTTLVGTDRVSPTTIPVHLYKCLFHKVTIFWLMWAWVKTGILKSNQLITCKSLNLNYDSE